MFFYVWWKSCLGPDDHEILDRRILQDQDYLKALYPREYLTPATFRFLDFLNNSKCAFMFHNNCWNASDWRQAIKQIMQPLFSWMRFSTSGQRISYQSSEALFGLFELTTWLHQLSVVRKFRCNVQILRSRHQHHVILNCMNYFTSAPIISNRWIQSEA